MYRIKYLIIVSLLALSGQAFAGHGNRGYHDEDNWARYYADTAVKQARKNRNRHCGYGGKRWTSNYSSHYNWALRKPRYKAQSEIDLRHRMLNDCRNRYGHYNNRHDRYTYDNRDHRSPRYRNRRGYRDDYRRDHRRRDHYYGREEFARWYADTATHQARQNHRRSCGYRGNRWTNNWNDHYRYALRADKYEAKSEVKTRDKYLRQCSHYGY